MTTMEKGEPIHAQFSMNCPKCNEDLSKFYKEELDKAREEGRQDSSFRKDVIKGIELVARQEERTRIISILDEYFRNLIVIPFPDKTLEAIKNKINE